MAVVATLRRKAAAENGTRSAPLKVSAATLRGWIESKEERSVINVLITPELASLMLEYGEPGKTNRKLSQPEILRHVRTLRENIWINTGQPFIFTDNHLHADGQHRASAIAISNIPAVCDLRFGILAAAFAAMDSGRPRSGADVLRMLGLRNANNAAAVARLVMNYETGLPAAIYRKVSNTEFKIALERWEDIPAGMAHANVLDRPLRSAATMTLGFFAHRTGTPEQVAEFFAILKSGEGSANAPPHRLQQKLLREGSSGHSGQRVAFLAMGVQAWNAWVAGKQITRDLSWTSTTPFPTVNGLVL